ncbi:fimbrial protein [Vibrio algarum]|uniref:Fimbrial protein n=1 Tax=Vibrio algarum TaxID=3020714 RepID=A0ABT4YT25_9VIBR|nr:fimbrial protein [Vibrio sp. KJ40-1]MDB1124356.1 fimbrial protein [Vibrio sp. KJ40-1]
MSFASYLFLSITILMSLEAHSCAISENEDMSPYSTAVELGPLHGKAGISYLTSWSSTVAQYFQRGTCTGNGYSTWVYSHQPAVGVIDDYPVYPTEHDNIGYVVLTRKDYRSPLLTTPFRTWFTDGTSFYTNIMTTIRFVNLGKLQAGVYTLTGKQAGVAVLSNSSATLSSVTKQKFYYRGFTLTVTASTCTVNVGDKNQTVILPSSKIGDFNGVGSMSGSQSFNIRVNCPSGIALYATMTDANLPTNTSSTLTLSQSSTASGFGLKIFANNSSTAVSYGPESAVKGNTNQWKVGGGASSPATNYTIPFVTRYVQTSATKSAGSVNAQSIITFSYQ